MKLVSGKTSLWVALTVLSAAMALGQGRGQRGGGTPQGGGAAPASATGATILGRACGSCHAADVIASYHHESADGYRDVINSMIAAGAQVTPEEIPVLADYLFTTYGKKPAAGASATQAAAADPGKAILEAACTTCHGLEPMASHVYDTKEPYEAVVRSMVAYAPRCRMRRCRCLWNTCSKFTANHPLPLRAPGATAAASTPDPGKAILESACTTCHGLDGLANHKYRLCPTLRSPGPQHGCVRRRRG